MRSIEPGDPQWERVAAMRARHEAMRVALVLPSWPVFGPAGPAENLQLAGYGQMDGETTSLDIVSGGPDPDLWVHSQVAGSGGHRSIDMVLADRFAETGREYPVPGQLADVSFGRALPASPHARPAVVRVDGVAHEARRQDVEEFTAWQLLIGHVVVTVIARNRVPADLELLRLLDLPPAPARPIGEVRRPEWTRSSDWTKEPDQSRPLWAHRGVVAMALAQGEAHRSTDRQNRPSPPLDPDWGLWWDAARDEQIKRTGATRHDALDAVGAMVDQLSELQESATWWGQEPLRRRAIDQVIWCTATGDTSLSSASAQQLWSATRVPPNLMSGASSDPAAMMRAVRRSHRRHDDWRTAWQDWAQAQPEHEA